MQMLIGRALQGVVGLVVAVAIHAAATAAPRNDVDLPPELVPVNSSASWRAFGAFSDFQATVPGEFHLAVGPDSGTAGFSRTFHLTAPEGRSYVINASIKVEGEAQATARLWARVDDADR